VKISPIPRATMVVFVITAALGVAQLAFPSLLATFSRDPSKVASGEWWRLATSLVFQDGGMAGALFNLAGLLVIGFLAERALGPARWLVLYMAGAAAGQAAGMLYGTAGAGNSIAVCGLAGGLLGACLLPWEDRLGSSVAALYAATLVTTAVGDSAAGIATSVVAVVAGTQVVARRDRLPRLIFPLAGLAVGAGLAVVSNLHGPALLGGLAAGAVLVRAWSPRPVPHTAG
jgi:membrane associated rhomboid family serine protease